MKNFEKEKNVTGEGWTSARTFLPQKEKKKNREPLWLVPETPHELLRPKY